MRDETIIIENVLADPDGYRARALAMDFDVTGNFPGTRTQAESPEFWLQWFDDIGFDVTHWPTGDNSANCAFQICLSGDESWVHKDDTDYAAVFYLTPPTVAIRETSLLPFHKHGTKLVRRRMSAAADPGGMGLHPLPDWNEEPLDENDWREHVFVEGLYNRMLIYPGRFYHRSCLSGFGRDKHNGRMTQVFFFNGSRR